MCVLRWSYHKNNWNQMKSAVCSRHGGVWSVECVKCSAQRKISLSSALSSSPRICAASSRGDNLGCVCASWTDGVWLLGESSCCNSFDHETVRRCPRRLRFEDAVTAVAAPVTIVGGADKRRATFDGGGGATSSDGDARFRFSAVLRIVTSSRYLDRMW